MGYCGWFAIESRTLEMQAQDGVLCKIDSHRWSSEHPDEDYDTLALLEDEGQDSDFVFCSLTRPAIFARNVK